MAALASMRKEVPGVAQMAWERSHVREEEDKRDEEEIEKSCSGAEEQLIRSAATEYAVCVCVCAGCMRGVCGVCARCVRGRGGG